MRAHAWRVILEAAQVAAQAAVGAVMGEADVAVVAARDVAAVGAAQGGVVTAAVEEEDGLLALVEAVAHLFREQGGKQRGALLPARLAAEVDDVHERQLLVVDPARQAVDLVFPG
jgi:hypothetical protein